MLTDEQLIDELRAALNHEAASVEPGPDLLQRVQIELAEPVPPRRWPRLSRGGLVTVLSGAATVAVVALALALVHAGHSARLPRAGSNGQSPPRSGFAVEATDPHGGRPWKLRIFLGPGGATCVEPGRMGSAGRFSPIPILKDCQPPDARGHAFLDVFARQMPANPAAGSCQRGPDRGCRLSGQRNLAFGLLGPDAVSFSFPAAGFSFLGPHPRGTVTENTGPDGAYLAVVPATRRSCVRSGHRISCDSGARVTWGTNLSSGVLTQVTYRGSICRLPAPSAQGVRKATCPRVGYVAYQPPHVTVAQVAAPVSGQAIRARRYCIPGQASALGATVPCDHVVPRGDKALVLPRASRQLLVRITFTARLAASNVHSVYEWSVSQHATKPSCAGPGSGLDATTMTPIHAGQRVVLSALEGSCPGRYTGLVTYQPNGGPGRNTLNADLPIHDGSVLVGRFSFTVR